MEITMTRLTTRIAAAALVLSFAVTAPAFAQSKGGGTCVNKAGEGTNSTAEGAKFQAWEAVLQATDWSVWGAMMSSKQAVGNAPGMKVSNLRTKCAAGGLGQTCVIQATLCR
jgi:hypothetical protein